MASSLKNCDTDSPSPLVKGVKKVVVVGEPRCGKTSFICSYYWDNFQEESYSHNGARVYPCGFYLKEHYGRVNVFEIPSDPEFQIEQRLPHYKKADVIVFIYAIDDPTSLEMLLTKWIVETIPNIIFFGTPMIFVGTKTDLRQNQQVINRLRLQNQSPVTLQQAKEVLVNFPATLNIEECSAIDTSSVSIVFDAIFRLFQSDELSSNE